MIGEAVLLHNDAEEDLIFGGPAPLDRIYFHTETRGDNITIERDDNSYLQ